MSAWPYIENIVTLLVIGACIVSIYALGGGLWGLVSLVLAFNLNQHKLR